MEESSSKKQIAIEGQAEMLKGASELEEIRNRKWIEEKVSLPSQSVRRKKKV